MAAFFFQFLRSQFYKLPEQTQSLDGQTFIVTGANAGLGYQAALSFVRQGAAKVVLACRSKARGDAAAASIAKESGRPGVAEVWDLDLGSYASVKAFAKRAEGLDRIDAVVENAGINARQPVLFEDSESTMTVNVHGTFLLLGLLLPTLRKVATRHKIAPTITVVASEVHHWAPYPEIESHAETGDLFAHLDDLKSFSSPARYFITKLIEVYSVRALAAQLGPVDPSRADGGVVINMVNPGLCSTEFIRDVNIVERALSSLLLAALGRTAAEGARTLVFAATAGPASHGKYTLDCEINDRAVSRKARSEQGQQMQEKVWKQLVARLEKIQPGIFQS